MAATWESNPTLPGFNGVLSPGELNCHKKTTREKMVGARSFLKATNKKGGLFPAYCKIITFLPKHYGTEAQTARKRK